ncbi:MAG TPA: hypothetical protein VHC70_08495 [Phycisphaerales bacterium]|nr:hypothetical protein [Phycisphaerales bacterium]
MKRVHSLAAVCGLSLTLSAAMAAPPVLDRVPDDALITIVIPSPQDMQKNLSALSTAIEAPAVPSVEDLLAMAGLGGGIDLKRSMAIVVMGPKELDKGAAPAKKAKDAEGEKKADKESGKDDMGGGKDADAQPANPDKAAAKKHRRHVETDDSDVDWDAGMQRLVVLVPITKYEDFLSNFGVKPAGQGKVDEFVTNQGEDGYSKPLEDGYAAMGPDKELVQAFTGKSGASPLKSRLGKAGEAVADSSDLIAIVNLDRVRPLATEGLKKMQKEARSQMDMMGEQGMEKNLDMVKWMGDTIVRDTQTLVAGVKTGSMGVTLEVVGAFKAESYLAGVFGEGGNATPILGKLFGGKYLAAGAIDLSSPGARQLMKDIITKVEMPGGEPASKAAMASIENNRGVGAVMGFPEGGAFSGILTATVLYTATKDPQQALKLFKDSLAAMDGAKVGELVYATKYTEPSGKEGDSPFAAWETRMTSEDGQIPAQMQQAMPLMFGPAGVPSGYVAVANDGLYTTYSKNSELMNKSINAPKEGNIGSDALIKQTQGMLPKNRMAEAYLGTRNILDMALPFAAMATGGGLPMDKIPEKLPPIAGAISAESGSVRLSMVIPAPVIKTGITLGEAIQEMKENAPGKGGKGEPKPEKGAGQPKF